MDLRQATEMPLVEEDYSGEEASVPDMPVPALRHAKRAKQMAERGEKEKEEKREEPELDVTLDSDWSDEEDVPQARYIIAESGEDTVAIYAGEEVDDGTMPQVASLDGFDVEHSLDEQSGLPGVSGEWQGVEPISLRQTHLIRVAAREGQDPDDLAGQLDKVWRDLNQASSIVGSGRHQLTNTQTMQLRMHLGGLFSLMEKLKILIERYSDDEELFMSLWMVYSALDMSVERYKLREKASIVAEDGIAPEPGVPLSEPDRARVPGVLRSEFGPVIVQQQQVGPVMELSDATRYVAVTYRGLNPYAFQERHGYFSQEALDAKVEAVAVYKGGELVLNPEELLGLRDGNVDVVEMPIVDNVPANWRTIMLEATLTFSPLLPKEVVQYREIRIVEVVGTTNTIFLHFSNQGQLAAGNIVPPPDYLAPLCFSIEDNGTTYGFPYKEELKVGDAFGVGAVVVESEDGPVCVAFFTANGRLLFTHIVDTPFASSLGVLCYYREEHNAGGHTLLALNPPPVARFHALEAVRGGAFVVKCCEICYDNYLPLEGRKLGCDHEYCAGCSLNHLSTAIDTGDVLEIVCPFDCGYELEDEELETFLAKEDYAKLKQFRFLARLRLEPDCRFCPTVDCGGGEIGERSHPDFPMLTCSRCHRAYCFDCGHVWHPQRTCQQAERDRKRQQSSSHKKAEKETRKVLKLMKTIKCRKCGALVQKQSGCNHMECRCGYQFCWLCGETILTAVGGSTYPLHYKTGACAGMQMSSVEELPLSRKVARTVVTPVKYGALGLVAAGAVVGGAVALGIAVPVAGVALPVYGGYRLAKHKKRKRREKKIANAVKDAELEAWYTTSWMATHDGHGSSDSDYEDLFP